ncbi:hypothetical protein MMSR116_29325 [Methylobacterium mesophilicum SR1.6/6]|uniref:DUF2282 domain-containing protein n=1 Tax=Methylobacterium mesophilicum SR1.6/6 TaxID=908290 RepID=A0A6B9FYF5_9HYPH|nr:hypothetical protein MMSR116_29325 [Methylobacterium mesophilicum SR1.6/6]
MRFISNAVVAVLLIASTGAIAQGRTYTRTFTCADLKAFVARSGNAVLASSDLIYETVHRDGGTCEQDETSAPAYEPTVDVPACFVGWRCKQRNSDSNQK